MTNKKIKILSVVSIFAVLISAITLFYVSANADESVNINNNTANDDVLVIYMSPIEDLYGALPVGTEKDAYTIVDDGLSITYDNQDRLITFSQNVIKYKFTKQDENIINGEYWLKDSETSTSFIITANINKSFFTISWPTELFNTEFTSSCDTDPTIKIIPGKEYTNFTLKIKTINEQNSPLPGSYIQLTDGNTDKLAEGFSDLEGIYTHEFNIDIFKSTDTERQGALINALCLNVDYNQVNKFAYVFDIDSDNCIFFNAVFTEQATVQMQIGDNIEEITFNLSYYEREQKIIDDTISLPYFSAGGFEVFPESTAECCILEDGSFSCVSVNGDIKIENKVIPKYSSGYKFDKWILNDSEKHIGDTIDYALGNVLKGRAYAMQDTPSMQVTLDMDSVSKTFLGKSKGLEVNCGSEKPEIFKDIPEGGVNVNVDASAPSYGVGFTIDRKYFLPYIDINGQKMQTTDWGGASEGETKIAVGLKEGFFKDGETYTLKLTVYVEPNTNWDGATGLKDVSVQYNMMDEGQECINTDNSEVFISDTENPEIENAVSSFEINVNIDKQQQTETQGDFDFDLKLDANKFSAENYGVVREHEGQLEEIESDYDSEHGELRFSSNKFSTYTIVEKEVEPVNPDNPGAEEANAESAQTGDMTFAIVAGLCIIAIAAGATLTIRKRRTNN